MNPESKPMDHPQADRLLRVADELRALSRNGLHYTKDPYQIERYQRILELSAQLMELVDDLPPEQIRRYTFHDLPYRAPYPVVDTAVFDEAGRILLIQRADNGQWALPGGAAEVGETPMVNAAREVWEETGYAVAITHYLGVFDNRIEFSASRHHLYIHLFAGRVVGGQPLVTRETLDLDWFTPEAIPWEALSGSTPARIRHALAWRQDPSLPPHFDRVEWQPQATSQHGQPEEG